MHDIEFADNKQISVTNYTKRFKDAGMGSQTINEQMDDNATEEMHESPTQENLRAFTPDPLGLSEN